MSHREPLNPLDLATWVKAAQDSPDVPWLVPDLIPRGGLVFVAGEPKVARKTWLAFALGMGMTSGKDVAGLQSNERFKVLYCSLEGSTKTTADRFPMLAKGLGIALDECANFFILHGQRLDMDNPHDMSEISEFVKEHEIDCVFIDTLSAAFLRDENSAEDVKVMLDKIHRIRDLGCAVVVVHHMTKAARRTEVPNPGMDMRGSSALAGAFDSILGVYQLTVDGETGTWLLCRGKDYSDRAYKISWEGLQRGEAKLVLEAWPDYPIPDPPKSSKSSY